MSSLQATQDTHSGFALWKLPIGDRLNISLGGRVDDPAFHEILRNHHVETIHSREASLDDVFVEVTGRQLT